MREREMVKAGERAIERRGDKARELESERAHDRALRIHPSRSNPSGKSSQQRLTRSTVISAYASGQHVLRGVRGAVLALVVRQLNTSLFRGSEFGCGVRGMEFRVSGVRYSFFSGVGCEVRAGQLNTSL